MDGAVLATIALGAYPSNRGMEIWKKSAFPTSPHPGDGYVRNVRVRKTDSSHEQPSPIDLLTFTGHVVVPVYERTLRVITPCPDVEFEE
jgi:hypothetical protein